MRQKGLLGEVWNLFCLDPSNTERSAETSLTEEVALITRNMESDSKPLRPDP